MVIRGVYQKWDFDINIQCSQKGVKVLTKEKGYRKILFCMLTVMMSLLLTACGISMKQHVNGTAAMASPTPGIGRTFRGVVTKNDTEIGQLEIRE